MLSQNLLSSNTCAQVCFLDVTQKLMFPCLVLLPSQPHTLISMVSVQLAQGNVTGALALFRHILVTALSSSSSSSFAGCEQCRASLPLLRCLQFYPFLYNLSHRQPCSRESIKHTQIFSSWLLYFFLKYGVRAGNCNVSKHQHFSVIWFKIWRHFETYFAGFKRLTIAL